MPLSVGAKAPDEEEDLRSAFDTLALTEEKPSESTRSLTGREYTLGWRMEPALHAVPRFGLSLRMARREHTADDRETAYAIGLGVTVAW